MNSIRRIITVSSLILMLLLTMSCSKTVKLGLDAYNGEEDVTYMDYYTNIKWKVEDNYSDSSCKFLGINYNGKFYEIGKEIKVKGDSVLTFVWEPCTVVLDYGYEDVQPEVITVDYYKTMKLPTAPSRSGYSFGGWIDDYYEHTYEAGEEVRITNLNIIFTAVWNENPVITLDYGYDNIIENIEIPYGSEYVLRVDGLKRPGYVFYRWKSYYHDYNKETTLTNVKESLKFVAEWKEAKYYVDFKFDYKTKSKNQSMQKKYNEIVEMPKVDEEDGWKFVGWSDGEKIYKQGEKAVIEDDVVFTALWEKTLTKIELYTEWLNKGEPILQAQLDQAIKNREIKLKTNEIEFAIKGNKLKLGTNTSSGYYTVYLDGSDEYIVTTSKSNNIAFKIKDDQSYNSALNVVNLCLSGYFYGISNGEFYESNITDDFSAYFESFTYNDNCIWFYIFNYNKLTKIMATVRTDDGYGYSMESHYRYNFEYLDFSVDDSDVNVDAKYKVIESTDRKMQIYNIFGNLNADRPGELLTLVEP